MWFFLLMLSGTSPLPTIAYLTMKNGMMPSLTYLPLALPPFLILKANYIEFLCFPTSTSQLTSFLKSWLSLLPPHHDVPTTNTINNSFMRPLIPYIVRSKRPYSLLALVGLRITFMIHTLLHSLLSTLSTEFIDFPAINHIAQI